MATDPDRVMSAASYVEAGAVLAGRRKDSPQGALPELDSFLSDTGVQLVSVDEEQARLAAIARIRFGRGFGARTGLNFGDCFAYALAKSRNAPLLFVGDDFRATDVEAAL